MLVKPLCPAVKPVVLTMTDTAADSQNIYYGANIDQFFRAGTYSEEVVLYSYS